MEGNRTAAADELPGSARLNRLASAGFIVLHLVGGLFSLLATWLAWQVRAFFSLVAVHLAELGLKWASLLVPILAPLLAVPFGVLVVLSGVGIRAGLGRWWRRQPEPNVALRLRLALYAVV